METLFPVVEDITLLSATELDDLLASYQAVSSALKTGEIDLDSIKAYAKLSEDERSAKVMEDWREAAVVVQSIRDRQAELAEETAEAERQADELHAAIGGEPVAAEGEEVLAAADDEDDDPDADEADEDDEALAAEADAPAADAEVETPADEPATVVAAGPPAVRTVRYPAVAKRHEAPPAGRALAALVASVNGDTVRSGQELDAVSYAMLARETAGRRGAPQHNREGTRERIPLAQASFTFPREMILDPRDPVGNAEKLAAIGSPYFGQTALDVLMASGGICAPPTPFYDLPQFSTTKRPVRDGLPSFQADRGGVSVPTVSTLGSVADSITVIEVDGDAAGGSAATKSCMDMDCAEWVDTFIGIISHCRKVGNLNGRTWPEGVAHENANTMALHSRTAEGRLLDNIDALSLDLTRAAVYGASSSLLYALTISRVGIISRLRMDENTRFNVILPFWAAAMFSLDIVNSQFDRFDTPQENVGALFSRFGFNVIWHIDEGIAGGADTEVWPDETDGTAQEDWPGSIVVARLFPAGHFIHLDGGTLELGLVRDSTLNETNDYELFGETFENVFAVGPTQAAHRLEITACPSGTQAALTTPFTCSPT